jgi:hypothetical protein
MSNLFLNRWSKVLTGGHKKGCNISVDINCLRRIIMRPCVQLPAKQESIIPTMHKTSDNYYMKQ